MNSSSESILGGGVFEYVRRVTGYTAGATSTDLLDLLEAG